MTLYLNLIYFPCWLAVITIINNIVVIISCTTHIMMMIIIIQVILMVAMVKFSLLNYLYKFVLVTILVAVIFIEVFSLLQSFCLLYIPPHHHHHLQPVRLSSHVHRSCAMPSPAGPIVPGLHEQP